jgi:hypothetical protein
MIRYALVCEDGHDFEAWFSSSGDYDAQEQRGLVECPHCGSVTVKKQIMAPAVRTARKAETARQPTASVSDDRAPDLAALARKVQAHIRSNFDYVGSDFAREATAIHHGEKPERLIYGETTPAERDALKDAGVPCAPLPEAFAPTPAKKGH